MTPDVRRQIARELFEAIADLKGSSWLLGHVGAWGDGDSTDAGFLADLKNYNRSQWKADPTTASEILSESRTPNHLPQRRPHGERRIPPV